MVHTPEHVVLTPKQKCEGKGGIWNEATQTCNLRTGEGVGETQQQQQATTLREQQTRDAQNQAVQETERRKRERIAKQQQEADLDKPLFGDVKIDAEQPTPTRQEDGRVVQDGVPGVIENGVFFADEPPKTPQQVIFNESGEAVGIVRPDGTALLGLSPADIDAQLQSGAVAADAQAQQDVSGQVGEFGELGIEGTPFDSSALAGAAARGVIPGLIRGVGTGVATGLLGAKAGALGGPATAVTLGALGFASGIASSLLGEMKSQRTDNTNAQQRVLDEGKQVLSDWITFAEANPSQKTFALAGFNQQLALIDQAFRQMKLDTSEDVLAFESAIPNLAEFNSFYSTSGERDVLSDEMRIAVIQPAPIDTRLIALMARRTP